jgi:NADPH:quinone reductase-like Zn-dependent oxidoreductase
LLRISGLQAVGTVTQAGSPGDRPWIGKMVLAYTPDGGSYAQFVAAKTNLCIEIPNSNADLYAALPTQGLTAYLTLTASSQLRPGETVLVQGASGGVGSLAVQIAKILGAGLVFGTASTLEKLSFIRSLGADNAFDYTLDDWPQLVNQNTSGRGTRSANCAASAYAEMPDAHGLLCSRVPFPVRPPSCGNAISCGRDPSRNIAAIDCAHAPLGAGGGGTAPP